MSIKSDIERFGFDAVMTKNLTELVMIAREKAIEECAKAAEKAWPRAHTYASENADLYRGQDHAVRTAVKAIRALAVTRPQRGAQ